MDHRYVLYARFLSSSGKIDAAVTSATIRGISLLYSIEDKIYLANDGAETILPLLFPILSHHSNFDVKHSTGELIALVLDARRELGLFHGEKDNNEVYENITEDTYEEEGLYESSLDIDFVNANPVSMEELYDVLPTKLYDMVSQ